MYSEHVSNAFSAQKYGKHLVCVCMGGGGMWQVGQPRELVLEQKNSGAVRMLVCHKPNRHGVGF